MIEWLNTNSGAVIAVATVIYAVVTLVLALEARRARKGAEAAAMKSEAAVREERELSVMPYLAAQVSVSGAPDGNLAVQIAAVNLSAHPALRVTVRLLHGPWNELPPTDPQADAQLLRAEPRFYAVVPPDGSPKPFKWVIHGSDLHEVTIARMHYFGPLGGSVWQTYELVRPEGGKQAFRDLQRYVLSSVPGAEPIIT